MPAKGQGLALYSSTPSLQPSPDQQPGACYAGIDFPRPAARAAAAGAGASAFCSIRARFRTMAARRLIGSVTLIYLFGLIDLAAGLRHRADRTMCGSRTGACSSRCIGWLMLVRGVVANSCWQDPWIDLGYAGKARAQQAALSDIGRLPRHSRPDAVLFRLRDLSDLKEPIHDEQAALRIRSRHAEGHHRPDRRLAQDLFGARRGAGAARAAARDRARCRRRASRRCRSTIRPASIPTTMPRSTSRRASSAPASNG